MSRRIGPSGFRELVLDLSLPLFDPNPNPALEYQAANRLRQKNMNIVEVDNRLLRFACTCTCHVLSRLMEKGFG
jgi:hypothetical protein